MQNNQDYTNFNKTSSVRDEYRTPPDQIWGDVIKHERIMEVQWQETWENSIMPKELRPPKNYEKSKLGLRREIAAFYITQPSPNIPPKSSAIIGWRSASSSNSMECFNVRYTSNKKRFVKEEFGYYRALKYQKEAQKLENQDTPTSPTRDEKFVRHTIKQLVC